jgi:hypothetical protein
MHRAMSAPPVFIELLHRRSSELTEQWGYSDSLGGGLEENDAESSAERLRMDPVLRVKNPNPTFTSLLAPVPVRSARRTP